MVDIITAAASITIAIRVSQLETLFQYICGAFAAAGRGQVLPAARLVIV
jgi:hypothetical protein